MALLFVIVITVLCCEIDCLTQSVKETRDDIGVIGHVALVALSVTTTRGYPTSQSIPTTWWRHQMETYSALLAICAGNSSVTGELPAQRPVTRSFNVFFDLRQIKRLNKQSRGRDLRRLRAHYDVTVIN